jgi:hypothetical protein
LQPARRAFDDTQVIEPLLAAVRLVGDEERMARFARSGDVLEEPAHH